MKVIACAAVLLGLVSTALGQTETLAPSPTESYGCQPHGDHWDCEGARTATTAAGAVTTTGAPATTSAAHDHDHDEDEGEDDDHNHDHTESAHTDAVGTGSLAPSPTESYGCEPHGDHWHCEGAITASATAPPTGTAAENAAASSSTSTGAAPHFEVVGLGFAGVAAVVAMAL